MPEQGGSPAQLAWSRFLARRSSRYGLGMLALIVLTGIYAPFLSNEVALVWWDQDGLRFPLIWDLFNRRSYEKIYDVYFNVLALLLPVLAVVFATLGRRIGVTGRIKIGVASLALVGTFCLLPVFPGHGGRVAVWDHRPFTASGIQEWSALPEAKRPFAVFTPVKHRFDATYPGAILQSPGTMNPVTGGHYWLGTDAGGHDVLTHLFFGARISLTVGLVAAGLSFLIGLVVGAVSGYFGGWVDLVLQRIVEIMMCFPTFILILTVVAMLGRDIFLIMTVIGITSWAGTARLVRGEFLAHAVRDYVTAVEALGLPRWRIMFRHILPNAIAPLLISLTFGIAGSVGAESALAFVGLGDPTAPSWGVLLEQGRENIRYPWLIYTPGLAIFAIVMTLNLLGNNLREAIDPKQRQ
ncbi:MAG: ABC transporter permease [Planctomycetes bacterium]|nr:ABC transporter permease [Planctomycetota bacterium]